MADIRCPNCGKSNPDLLDVCQFCLTPLKPDSVLRMGEQPTKKNTGELEPILPDWLKDVRQQARDAAETEAAQAASVPKSAKEEPLDLLAGLASQTGSDDEEVPDWLTAIHPSPEPKSQVPTAPEPDSFAPFDKSRAEPSPESTPPAVPESSDERDELSDWFAQAAGRDEETIEPPYDAAQIDRDWVNSFESPPASSREQAPQEEEDLSWLRNLEQSAKQTGDLQSPRPESDWSPRFESPSTPAGSASPQEDLSWLDSLGGIEESPQKPFAQTPAASDDLSWLDRLGGMPASEQSVTPESNLAPQEDLSWLNNLGGTAGPVQPFDAASEQPAAAEPFIPGEDLDWLKNLGVSPESAQPSDAPASDMPARPFSQDDLSWLNEVDRTPPAVQPFDVADLPAAAPFVEPESAGRIEEEKEPEPDWLKNAAETPATSAPGDTLLDWLAQSGESEAQEAVSPEGTSSSAPYTDIFSSPQDASLSTQELDSLFSAEMPDWLSRPEPGAEEPAPSQALTPPPGGEDSLAPVELPSWVQAMRPVEALISETAPSTEDQPEEQEGPLAGLRGVIPGAPIGSSTRPKPVSLKLQVSSEQQASAALLEEILGSETTPRALVDSSFIPAQHVLRWALAGLFLVVLGIVISLRPHSMPVSSSLPLEGRNLAGAVLSVPVNSNILVIVDYEPALAGEMEAIGSPLLNQMVSLGRHNLSLLSTSPTGPALVERLLTSAGINTADGFAYQSGVQYRNLGFLPGGSAGVLGFIDGPAAVVPAADELAFSEYAAVVVLTDHAESGRVWVEQLHSRRQFDFAMADQPLLMVASAQAGPLLQPYVSAGQVDGMISGLADAARYDANAGRAGAARQYWDPFGFGLIMAVIVIVVGSLWSLLTGIRARRAAAEQG